MQNMNNTNTIQQYGLMSFVQNPPIPATALNRQQRQQQTQFQMHHQMFMDHVTGVPITNHSNDFCYTEMHSTWQYHCNPPIFANIQPPLATNSANISILPNINVPPPPFGTFPVSNTVPGFTGYTTAFQSNAGFISPDGAMITNTVGAVSGFANQMFSSASASSSSSYGSDSVSSLSSTSINGHAINMSFSFNDAGRSEKVDASTQADLIKNTPPLEKLNVLSRFATPTASCKNQLDVSSSLSSTSTTEVGASICLGTGIYYGSGDGESLAIHKTKLLKNSEVKLSQQKLQDVTRLSLRGSELAEKFAYTHRNRPCFKKIDSLCARMKQDLIRPDGVLPNINSQGIAWAVKDFIFVFTRIVNAWIIMKGYVYNTPDGLNKIKNALPEGFMEGFSNWQDATLIFIEFLINSFGNLDGLVQKQKCSYSKNEKNCTNNVNNQTKSCSDKISPSHSPQNVQSVFNEHLKLTEESLNKNYMYTMVENSEQSQRNANANGTYFRTGTYQPLQKSLEDHDTLSTDYVATTIESNKISSAEAISEHDEVRKEDITIHFNDIDSSFLNGFKEPQPSKAFVLPIWTSLDDTDNIKRMQIKTTSVIGRDVMQKLSQLSDRILHLNNIEVFFKKDFTKNYFPDFILKCKYDYIDLRQIVLKCQNAQYYHLYEAVHDLKRIIYVAKNYLQLFENLNLKSAITKYESEIRNMLEKPPYVSHQFDHLRGRPNEKLFNYSI